MMLDGTGGIAMPDHALKHAKATCEGSNPVARGCHVLARIHERGLAGIERDVVRARDLYDAACKDGHGASCGRLGDLSAKGPDKNVARARELWKTGCHHRDPRACLALGEDFARTSEIGDHRFQAEQALERACELRVARGCAKAAVLRWPERRESDIWRKVHTLLAAGCGDEASDPLACEKRGDALARGLGVARDEERAAGFYSQACRALDTTDDEGRAVCARAKTKLGRRAKVARLAAGDFAWACDNGDPWGCVELGIRYESGEGVPADPERALALFEQACARRADEDRTQAAACARAKERRGARASEPAEARRLFEESCAGGSGHGCLRLAEQEEIAWKARTEKTVEAMNALVAIFAKGCTAPAPAVEACVRAEALERSRGGPYVERARAHRDHACTLEPGLELCAR